MAIDDTSDDSVVPDMWSSGLCVHDGLGCAGRDRRDSYNRKLATAGMDLKAV